MNKDVLEVFVLSLPSKLGHEKVAMSTAASVARLMGFSEDRIEDLKSAVAEACINSIEHGNRLDESLKVGVILSMTATTLEIRVCDQGSGPHRQIPLPDLDSKMDGEESPRGMGMFLIQALMDEVEWINSQQTGSCARLVIHLKKPDANQMQDRTTSVKVSEIAGSSGEPITVLRFSGDITSTSKEAMLGTYQGLLPEVKRILLDLSKVEYINSSGIALIIQVLMQARNAGQSVQTFGLSDHFKKVFTMVGLTKYTNLHSDELSACAAFAQ